MNSGVIGRPSKVRLNSTSPMWRLIRSTTFSGSSIAARVAVGADDHVPPLGQQDEAGGFDLAVVVGGRPRLPVLVHLGQGGKRRAQVDADRLTRFKVHGYRSRRVVLWAKVRGDATSVDRVSGPCRGPLFLNHLS